MDELSSHAIQDVSVVEAASASNVASDILNAPNQQSDRLNHLIDLVGELVIASASASLLAHRSGQNVLAEANSVVSQLVESIRDAALQMRMVKIGESFDRITLAAHEMAREQGKDIEVLVTGADTELDKSVVEKIGAPLLQLVTSAIKQAATRIQLNAYHDSASIVIEVVDDGAGPDREAIKAEAIQKGIIQPDQVISDDEMYDLLFEHDFSGGDTGLKAVKQSISALRGAINLSSQPGEGSCFTIRLPLTLAIIDGFLTGVAQSSYVIPLDSVVECLELTNTSIDRDYINLRGEVLPYVRLREMFEVPGDHPQRENVVVVHHAGQKSGIVVDQLLGEFQTVIKPLGTLFRHMRGIAGSTILGSGEVALILDVQALIGRCSRTKEQPAHSAQGTHSLESH